MTTLMKTMPQLIKIIVRTVTTDYITTRFLMITRSKKCPERSKSMSRLILFLRTMITNSSSMVIQRCAPREVQQLQYSELKKAIRSSPENTAMGISTTEKALLFNLSTSIIDKTSSSY
jgi:hypothetical protein